MLTHLSHAKCQNSLQFERVTTKWDNSTFVCIVCHFEVLASVSVITRVLFTSVVIVTLLHHVILVVFKAGWFILGLWVLSLLSWRCSKTCKYYLILKCFFININLPNMMCSNVCSYHNVFFSLVDKNSDPSELDNSPFKHCWCRWGHVRTVTFSLLSLLDLHPWQEEWEEPDGFTVLLFSV